VLRPLDSVFAFVLEGNLHLGARAAVRGSAGVWPLHVALGPRIAFSAASTCRQVFAPSLSFCFSHSTARWANERLIHEQDSPEEGRWFVSGK